MPSKKARPESPAETIYTVFYTGDVRTAAAREILGRIQKSSQASGELRSMNTKKYADALVDDAPYFLPKTLLTYFHQQHFGSQYDRALEYLAAMPTSGVRILARE